MPLAAPYVTPAELEEHLGSDAYLALTDRDGDGVADVAAVEKALLAASSRADSYMARHLPLAVMPEWLPGLVMDLAIYRLSGSNTSQAERDRYEDAVAFLRDVQKNKAGLGVATPQPDDDNEMLFEGAEQVMSRASTGGLA